MQHKHFISVILLLITMYCYWESLSHQLTGVTHSFKIES